MDIVEKMRDESAPLECIIGHLVSEVQRLEKELTSEKAKVINMRLGLKPPLRHCPIRMPYDDPIKVDIGDGANRPYDDEVGQYVNIGDGANRPYEFLYGGQQTETVYTGE